MKLKLLLIEDEPGLVLTIVDRLTAEGYLVDSVTDGSAGLALARRKIHDLIILDIMLPGMDGLAICRELRSEGCNTPILMLTARTRTEDKITGLNLGADDYLAKPFDMGELSARIAALLRRCAATTRTAGNRGTPTASGDLPVIDLRRGYILNGKEEHSLSAQEIKLLDYFYMHPDIIISREELLHSVWGYDTDITTRTIDVHIARIRQKMGDIQDSPRYIHTIRGIGYKFTPPV